MKEQGNAKEDYDSESITQPGQVFMSDRNRSLAGGSHDGQKGQVITAQQSNTIPAALKDSGNSNQVNNNNPEHTNRKHQAPQKKQERNQPQQQAQAGMSKNETKGKWKQQVGAAKVVWGKLTDDELLKTEGHSQRLAGLVQERYAITREEADRQVSQFLGDSPH